MKSTENSWKLYSWFFNRLSKKSRTHVKTLLVTARIQRKPKRYREKKTRTYCLGQVHETDGGFKNKPTSTNSTPFLNIVGNLCWKKQSLTNCLYALLQFLHLCRHLLHVGAFSVHEIDCCWGCWEAVLFSANCVSTTFRKNRRVFPGMFPYLRRRSAFRPPPPRLLCCVSCMPEENHFLPQRVPPCFQECSENKNSHGVTGELYLSTETLMLWPACYKSLR
jgi:hypothetical protein